MTNGDDKCEIYFNQGQGQARRVWPVTGDRSGFQSACAGRKEFQIDFKANPRRDDDPDTQGLLMEGLRLLDESQRDAAA